MNRPIKIAIITNIPTPYRKAQWDYYSKCKDLEITVFYCAPIEKDRYWDVESSEGVKEVFLKGFSHHYYHFNPGVFKVLFSDFDMFFVGGYGYPTVILSIILLKLLKKPWVMIIDGISPVNIKNVNIIAEKIKKMLIKGAEAYFANGTVSAEYLKKYDICSEKIFNQYMTVDVDGFMEKGKKSLQIRNKIRQKIGINEDSVVIMYAGRLVKHKGVQDMIDAVGILKGKNYDIKALIVGDGNYKYELKKKSENINSDVIFTGHIDPEEIYKYYYASDIFILPTYDDPWGLVVNEAISCGLPVIVTNAAGCSLDLVKNNGYVINVHNTQALSIAIKKIMVNPLKFRQNSIKIIKKWTYKESMGSFLNTINYVWRNINEDKI